MKHSIIRYLGAMSLLLPLAACDSEPIGADDPYWHDHSHDETKGDTGAPEAGVRYAAGKTVHQAALEHCSTAAVRWLSEQLIDEINCIRPGFMSRIDNIPGVTLSSGTFPFLQTPTADGLRRAASGISGSIRLNSALRTVAQQYMLYTWYRQGLCTDVVSLAAPPGRSNHESGLAIDVDNYSTWRSTLSSRGFAWLGGNDPVHFDYTQGGTDLRNVSVHAFQRLWNRNNPQNKLAEDGQYGPSTEAALRQAPAGGFAIGASCTDTETPTTPKPDLAIEVYWSRNTDGSYELRALAPQSVTRVEYKVDGFKIADATRTDGDNFPDRYTFSQEKNERLFEVLGYDAQNQLVARGIGLMDVTAGVAVYIKQMGESLYEIGLERAPTGVAGIEVMVDSYSITDSVSGETRSPRNAVRYRFSTLGRREFAISTFNTDGSFRGTLRRTFTLE